MKPDWCPSGVWERANSSIHGYSVFSDGIQIDNVAASIARALLSERERALEEAAGVATERDEHGAIWPDGLDIANAIRALKGTP